MRRVHEHFTKELEQVQLLQYHFEALETTNLLWIAYTGIYGGQAKEFDARSGGRAESSVPTIKMVLNERLLWSTSPPRI